MQIDDEMVEAAEAEFYRTQGDMRAALQAALSVRGEVEPVAWQYRTRFREEVDTSWSEWSPWIGGPVPEWDPEMIDHVQLEKRPLYTTPPAQAVAVKGLEWPDECRRGRRVHAMGVGFRYCIAHYGGDAGSTIYRWAPPEGRWSLPYETYEATKAAAQADYEKRIRSALVSTPPDLAERVRELEEALRPFAEFGQQSTDENGWASNIHREGMSTWFGSKDFRRAARAMEPDNG